MDKHSARKIEKRRRGGKARNTVLLPVALLIAATLCIPGFFSTPLRAGGDLRPRAPRSAAMAGAGCALPGGHLLNPALLTTVSSAAAALQWTPARFGLTELGDASAAWAQPLGTVTARLSLQHSGFEAYRELRTEAAAAVPAAPRLSLGAAASMQHVSMARYGGGAAWGLDIGALLEIVPGLYCGAVAENALQLSFADDERLPVRLRMGVGWDAGALRIAADLEKESRHAVTVRLGVEYVFEDCLSLRAGAGSAPGEAAGGFGLRTGGWDIGYAVAVHPDLGWTHTAGIGFRP